MVGRGMLTAQYRMDPMASFPPVEVIVPVYGNPEGLERCLAALAGQTYPRNRYRVTVVDDGTPEPLRKQLGERAGGGCEVRWIRLEENRGPGFARNAGAGLDDSAGGCAGTARTASPPASSVERPGAPHGENSSYQALAFIDSDCVPESDWLAALVPALQDPWVAAVGGRVGALHRESHLALYEDACSSLYLGRNASAVASPHRGPMT